MYDRKWKIRLAELGKCMWLVKRYIDDTSVCLPPIKPGWRIESQEFVYCKKWEKEDVGEGISGEELTKMLLLQTM